MSAPDTGGGLPYDIKAEGPGDNDLYDSGDSIGVGDRHDNFIITFNSGNVRAVGGNFIETDEENNFMAVPIKKGGAREAPPLNL